MGKEAGKSSSGDEREEKILVISLILLAVLMCFSMLPMFGIFTFLWIWNG